VRRIRSHLTYANVMATLAVFIALGGTALASLIITSNSQVDRGTISGHEPPSGKHPNIIAGSINGKDIANRSGVDTCQAPLVKKFGPICAGSDAGARTWRNATDYCVDFGLRLPSVSEAVGLAKNYDVPGVSGSDYFWTDNVSEDNSTNQASGVNEDSAIEGVPITGTHPTVCVTDPSA
jgi:hypothetical protein